MSAESAGSMEPRLPTLLVQRLDAGRDHVLQTIEGLDEPELDTVVAPSGWTARSMISHLLYDVEIFWLQAVLAADEDAIARVRDGWTAPSVPGPELRASYRDAVARGNHVLAEADLDAPPAWWPPPEVFGGPRLSTGWEILLRVLEETSVHAGHLDMARERLDGRQHLVVT
ncbi:DUF664 domain-containing protein [Pseudactinotalea terrae]|uniref:mycothiol transferase n=1 Tax=Pseudactinotalea terrae TaxID=1743262 RepID=UPI001F4F3851|nr:DUF664 domain-containing protein [Pseudactinotalea terrae]